MIYLYPLKSAVDLRFNSHEPKAYRMGLKPATLSIMNIFETGRQITIIFYAESSRGRRKAVLGFGAAQTRTVVSMAIDSSHRVIMEIMLSPSFLIGLS